MTKQSSPFLVFLHAGELRAADSVDERQRRVGEQDRLALVHTQFVDVGPLGELEVPGAFRRRPRAEAAAAGGVRLLVAGADRTRQGGVVCTREHAPDAAVL